MKKFITIALAVAVLFSFAACQNQVPTYKNVDYITIEQTGDILIGKNALDPSKYTVTAHYTDGTSGIVNASLSYKTAQGGVDKITVIATVETTAGSGGATVTAETPVKVITDFTGLSFSKTDYVLEYSKSGSGTSATYEYDADAFVKEFEEDLLTGRNVMSVTYANGTEAYTAAEAVAFFGYYEIGKVYFTDEATERDYNNSKLISGGNISFKIEIKGASDSQDPQVEYGKFATNINVTTAEETAEAVYVDEDEATKLVVKVKNTSRDGATNYYGDAFTYTVHLAKGDSPAEVVATAALDSSKYDFIGTKPTATTYGKEDVKFTVYLKSDPTVQGTATISKGTDYVTSIKVTSNQDAIANLAGSTTKVDGTKTYFTYEVTYAINNNTTPSGIEAWNPANNVVVTNPDVPAKGESAKSYVPSLLIRYGKEGAWTPATGTTVTIPAAEA